MAQQVKLYQVEVRDDAGQWMPVGAAHEKRDRADDAARDLFYADGVKTRVTHLTVERRGPGQISSKRRDYHGWS